MLANFGIGILLTIFISLLATPIVKRLALRLGAVDLPDERKIHKEPMPRLGGLAIYAAFISGVLYLCPIDKDTLVIYNPEDSISVMVYKNVWKQRKI